MVWNQGQQIALAIVPKFSSFFSLLGSSWVIVEVTKETEKTESVYHRLLCAMSIYDVLESVWNFASTWPIPRGTPNIWGASGTTQSCTAQGFFLQLGLAIPMYNASLSIYYLLVIKYNMSDAKLTSRVEPYMHGASFVFPAATACASIGLKLYNSANLWCWLAPLPADCMSSWQYGAEGNCVRGDNAGFYRWAFYFIPLWLCLFLSTVAMVLVSRTVRKREEATVAFRHPNISRIQSSRVQSQQTQGYRNQDSFRGSDYLNEQAIRTSAVNEQSTRNDNNRNSTKRSERPNTSTKSSVPGFSSLRQSARAWKERKVQYRAENPKSVEVFHQALFYLLAFYMTHTFSTVNRILQQTRGESYFPLVLLHAFFDPLQGFLNFLVYRRPRYLRHRKQNLTRVEAVKRTLQWSWMTNHEERRQGGRLPSSHHGESGNLTSSGRSSGELRVSGLFVLDSVTEQIEGRDDDDECCQLETVNEIGSMGSGSTR